MTVGCGSPARLALRGPRLPLIAKPDRRGEISAAAATLFGNPASKTLPIAVPVENIFS
jgi:hypothetical protein